MNSSIKTSLAEAAEYIGGVVQGDNVSFTEVSIDTRQLQAGQLYIAIKGERFDGHDFLQQAEQKGASAALISQPYHGTLPVIQVKDTIKALADLARLHQTKLAVPTFAVTGSCGKTTTKNLLANILSQRYNTLVNASSFNNNIGVPLTLLQLNKDHQVAVTEMGANHAGEISELTAIGKPQIAMITNAYGVHLEGFGDLEGVARAKGEIFQGLADNGTAILNADNQFFEYWKTLITSNGKSQKIISFGIKNPADVTAKNIRLDTHSKPLFALVLPDKNEIEIALPLLGEHNIYNALGAAAAAFAFGLKADDIQQGLQTSKTTERRLVELTGINDACIIDDSYNANPTSVKAAIDILSGRPGQRILALGDMLELGKDESILHQQIGEYAKQAGLDALYCFGPLSQHAATAFGKNAEHFTNHESLIKVLLTRLDNQTTVLVKGSKSMNMNKVVKALMAATTV